MKRTGRWPALVYFRAASKAFRSSATPDMTAESGNSVSPTSLARRRASVVLPQPGGPQRMSEPSFFAASIRPSGASAESASS